MVVDISLIESYNWWKEHFIQLLQSVYCYNHKTYVDRLLYNEITMFTWHSHPWSIQGSGQARRDFIFKTFPYFKNTKFQAFLKYNDHYFTFSFPPQSTEEEIKVWRAYV